MMLQSVSASAGASLGGVEGMAEAVRAAAAAGTEAEHVVWDSASMKMKSNDGESTRRVSMEPA